MERYIIFHGIHTIRTNYNFTDEISEMKDDDFVSMASEYDRTEFMPDVLLETFDRAEADKFLNEHKSEAVFRRSHNGFRYEWEIEIYEMDIDTGEIEDDEFIVDDTKTVYAPFIVSNHVE